MRRSLLSIAAALLLLAALGMPARASGPNLDLGAVLSLQAASASKTSADEINNYGRGVKCLVDVTAITGTSPTLTVAIRYKDTASGAYLTLLSSAALTAVGATMLTVYPGVTPTSNASASDIVPHTWDVAATVGGTSPSVTATIGCSVVE